MYSTSVSRIWDGTGLSLKFQVARYMQLVEGDSTERKFFWFYFPFVSYESSWGSCTLIVAENIPRPRLFNSESPVVDSQWGAQRRLGYDHSHIQQQAKWIKNYCFIKTPTKYWEFFLTLFVKTTNFQLVFSFEQTRTVTIFGEHGTCLMAHNTLMAKPIRALELHYPMIQFLIIMLNLDWIKLREWDFIYPTQAIYIYIWLFPNMENS